MMSKSIKFSVCTACLLVVAANPVFAQEEKYDSGELSKELDNPIAALITVPIEYNKDSNIGPGEDGEVKSIKFTPVYPFDINKDWNLISRAIFSYVDQDLPDAGLDETGLSDIVLTLYFSPKEPGSSGVTWGVGPIILLDSATEDSLGAGKWGLGPAGVALKQTKSWTVGALVSYLQDVGGDSDRTDVEQLFMQPFVSYQLDDKKTSFTLQSEITRDLEENETSAFALFQVGRMFTLEEQIMQWRLGVRHWYEDGDGTGPDSTELNARLTFLFPK